MVSGQDDATRQRLSRIVRAIDWSSVVSGEGGEGGGASQRLSAFGLALEEGWRHNAWSSSPLTQLRALTGRHWTLLMRHPLLVGTNLAATFCIAWVCAWAFWRAGTPVNQTLSGGVLQRMGLLFFLGAHFLLSGLANIGVWKQERLLYFHERGVGCYGTVPFVLSKTIFADALPMRILPALVCSAVVYPTVGLAGISGPGSAG